MDRKIKLEQMWFKDLIEVYDLGNKLFTADKSTNLYRTWDEYEVIERFMSDEKFCWVARDDKKVIGFTLGALIEKEKNPWTYGYVIWMGVDPQYAGAGIGKKLLDKMSKLFKAEGAKIIMVGTSNENEAAIKFFKKNGFSETEQHVFLSKNIAPKK